MVENKGLVEQNFIQEKEQQNRRRAGRVEKQRGRRAEQQKLNENRLEKEEGKQNSRGDMRAEQKISRESSGSRTVEEQGEQNNRGVEEQTIR